VEDGLAWVYHIRALDMSTHECNEWKAPVIVGGHVRACLHGLRYWHDSLPWAREARDAEAEAMYHQWALEGKEVAMADCWWGGAGGVVQV
jgi:hypothetical protein